MNVETLKNLIREEVRTVFREELKEVLTEAVRIASTPTQDTQTEIKESVIKSPVREVHTTVNPVERMLEETRLNFTSQDAKNFYGGSESVNQRAASMAHSMGMAGDAPGVDLGSLPFLKKAKNILDKTKEIGKQSGY